MAATTDVDSGRFIVYCAGPQHSPEEKRSMARISSLIEGQGYRTYCSIRDGLEHYACEASEMLCRAAFALEVYQVVHRCHALVFNMNGRVPDQAGVFTAALAFMCGKPVVLYKNDNRSVFHGSDNPMVTCLSMRSGIVHRLRKIPGVLTRRLRATEPDTCGGSWIPEYVRREVELGGQVWSLLQDTQLQGSAEDVYHGYEKNTDRLKSRLEHMEALGSAGL